MTPMMTVNCTLDERRIDKVQDKDMKQMEGKRGLVVGIANAQSIAYGCAKVFRDVGADVAVTYLNEKAEPHVRPLAESLQSQIIVPCDVREVGQLEAVFAQIEQQWDSLISYCTPSHTHPRKICSIASRTVPQLVLRWRWTFRATRSFAWRSWRNR